MEGGKVGKGGRKGGERKKAVTKSAKAGLQFPVGRITRLWGIFERFDRDRSGKIDLMELKDALLSLGFVVPPYVLQLLISKYDDGYRRRGELNFDSFVECGMIVKGLTEKFKEKDPRYTGGLSTIIVVGMAVLGVAVLYATFYVILGIDTPGSMKETTLYVTLEPCAMCVGAIIQARVDIVVWGAPNKLLGADGSWVRLFPTGSEGQTSSDPTNQPTGRVHPFHPKMTIRRGILSTECADIRRGYRYTRFNEGR